jgi:hypothetical protein
LIVFFKTFSKEIKMKTLIATILSAFALTSFAADAPKPAPAAPAAAPSAPAAPAAKKEEKKVEVKKEEKKASK